MPRPRPPRKRPRKRPDAQQRVLRAEAALNKQTAQNTQQKQQPPGPPDAPRGASAAAPATGDELWSRRSYAVLVAIVAVLQLPITVIDATGQTSARFGAVNLAAFALIVYVYPPLYKRLRLKPRPRGPTPPRGSVRGQSKR